MNHTPTGLSGEIDINVPNVARVYDYLLGGAHNFVADRQLAAQVERTMPRLRDIARLNRSFLRRAVRFMVDSGVRQFLDLGSGIPTVGNVHEIAQGADPGCRVVYVDYEPVAVIHSRLLLRGNKNATAIQADIRDPEDILSRQETRALLNFDEPVGLLALLMLHYIPDPDDPYGLLARYRDALVPGSALAITHVTTDGEQPELTEVVDEVRKRGAGDATPRTYEQILDMFAGFELVTPGVVGCAAWRPTGPGDFSEDSEANRTVYAGVGLKPGTPEPEK